MVRFVAVSGFLGAGKTTTMLRVAERWQATGRRVAVITNDQGTDLVDTATARSRLAGVGEVTGGCFCCRFEDLVDMIRQLVAEQSPDVVIAEAVGSCTDLAATVVRPLRRWYGDLVQLAPLTTVVDPLRYLAFERAGARGDPETDLMYLYGRQLHDAEVIAVNKADLLARDTMREVLDSLSGRHPSASVVGYSARRGDALEDVLWLWDQDSTDPCGDLDVDYERYGAAEAQLAWLNQTFGLSARTAFVPGAWADAVLRHTRDLCRAHGHLVGHVKVAVASPAGTAKASLVDEDADVSVDEPGPASAHTAEVTLNARVECAPAQLEALIAAAVDSADHALRVTSGPPHGESFRPGRPMPRHRVLTGTRH